MDEVLHPQAKRPITHVPSLGAHDVLRDLGSRERLAGVPQCFQAQPVPFTRSEPDAARDRPDCRDVRRVRPGVKQSERGVQSRQRGALLRQPPFGRRDLTGQPRALVAKSGDRVAVTGHGLW